MARRILETWEQARDLHQLGFDLFWADTPFRTIPILKEATDDMYSLNSWDRWHNLYGFAVEVEESNTV